MRRRLSSVILVLCVMLTICSGCFIPVSAEDGLGTMKLICKANKDIPSGMTWWIYRIGSYDGAEITLEDQFEDCPVSFGNYSASDLSDAASTLETMALLQKTEYDMKMTDQNGELTFTDVRDGVYLVASSKFKSGDTTFNPTSSIVVMDSSQTADMTVYPKITSVRTLDSYFERHQIMKVWENDQAMPVKPTKILVEIYSDLELYDTVELNVENNWTYSWEVDVSSDWRIVEKDIPEGCTVVYRDDGMRYVIVNTYEDPASPGVVTTAPVVADATDVITVSTNKGPVGGGDDNSSETAVTTVIPGSSVTVAASQKPPAATTGGNKLPQTGQLWWPVPVMTLLGLVLVGVGIRIITATSNKKEDK